MLNKIKTELSELLFLSRDALHIHIGLGIYVAAMLVFHRGPASILPWLVVLACELANEFVDSLHHFTLDVDISGSLRDIGNTMLWPTVVLLLARRFAKAAPHQDAELSASAPRLS